MAAAPVRKPRAHPSKGAVPTARAGKGRFVRTPEQAAKDGEAARMRARGMTLREIAAAGGWGSTEGARLAIQRALTAAAADGGGEELLSLRRAELEEARREAWAVVRAPGYVTSPRGEVVCGPDRQPLVDQGARLAAIDKVVRISESERRLLGLDARDGLREREIRLREREADAMVRVLEVAARALGLDVDDARVAAVIEGAIVEVEQAALPPGQA